VGVGAAEVVYLLHCTTGRMKELFTSFLTIVGDSAPYLLLGFALAGVLHVILARFPFLMARLTRPGRRSVLYGALIGVPMPLCSCSVLPAAMGLRRDGASRGATASFLVSVPETDVVSILITYALIGPVMAIYRPIAAFLSALATGFAVDSLRMHGDNRPAVAQPDPACGCEETAGHPHTAPEDAWWKRSFRYGFIEIFDDIILQLLLGIGIAAALTAWLPPIESIGNGTHVVWQYLAMLAIGIPLYVCATASTPVAAGFIAAGISPGAAMVFLLAGPATNVAGLLVLRSEFGPRFLVTYVIAVAVASVVMGIAFDVLASALPIPPVTPPLHVQEGWPALRIAAAAVFLLLTLVSIHRTRALQRAGAHLVRLGGRSTGR
jgi:uncharacterized membrane protein YraQ (UPF0718 family)